MNEKQKEEHLSTADLAGVTEKERFDSDDNLTQDEHIETPLASRTAEENKFETNGKPVALLPDHEMHDFQSRWSGIQTGFVDEPRSAVENADALVAEIMQHLAQIFSKERAQLEDQWTRGDDVSTEDLRLTLQRYRSFFTRLLSI